ncbi:hypothetical protein [Chlamydia caviae]|uniref:Lipoprotein n=1 Tax=Chlamydia caviae (strain ATCC VR-813 / DSM 19441 / 03DC25 / GPIC) TaxID=227941 RepID=Q824K4_CHLCV|nr:hypothetical protein [Chlamydia caviae]AAP04893.1 hypothetical protein CCA_00141 [Chlamydia caviae GPIC]
MKKLILALLLASSCACTTAVFADDSEDVKVLADGGDSENGSENDDGNESSETHE